MSKKKPVLRKLAVLAAMLAMLLVGAVPALAQGAAANPGTVSSDQSSNPPTDFGDGVIQGTITNISGSVVLVEEDPSDQPKPSSPPSPPNTDKGYFTVTDETEITKQQDGKQAPATFEDLEVGQIVEAAYAGPAVVASYPSQGSAESIAILEETACMLPEGCDDSVPPPEFATFLGFSTFSFELTVECKPPTDAAFFGNIGGDELRFEPMTLADPDGDGVFTGSIPVSFGEVPPGAEQTKLPVQIVQDIQPPEPPITVIRDFGVAPVDEDRTFTASISFCEGGDQAQAGGAQAQLPATGGVSLVALGIGALLVGGGLLAHRLYPVKTADTSREERWAYSAHPWALCPGQRVRSFGGLAR